ncbi:MAG TPA: sigma-70 family RNA polymerase sigma factor [Isosphaeraceae bacterium]|jgi:RNA polymerase sigma-70 factor (ECF subfamily)
MSRSVLGASPSNFPETSQTLLVRVRDPGDVAAWGEFDALYRPLIRGVVRKQGVSGHDADDVVQEVFRRLVRALPAFSLDHRRGRFRSWLYSVTHCTTQDWLRARSRQGVGVVDPGRVPDRAGEVPEAEWLRSYRRRVLEFAQEKVRSQAKPRDWYAFEQCLVLRRRAAVVAEELGITVANVYTITSRVFARIRDLCLEYDEDLSDGTIDLPG